MLREIVYSSFALLMALVVLPGCRGPAAAPDSRLKVVATTTIVGDVVHQIGGEAIDLTVLLSPGSDPHSFSPAPQDVAAISDADVVFINGAGLEEFLTDLLENAGGEAELIDLSQDLALLKFAGAEHDEGAHEGEHDEGAHEGDEHEGEHHHEMDPHIWTSPRNVLIWTVSIELTLSRLDAVNAKTYQTNAAAYREELAALDAWIVEQIAQIPEARRVLLTDHLAFDYLAAHYGLEQLGAVVPGYSTAAQPSAQDIAALEDAIRAYAVPAIFVGSTVNPALSQRVAEDTGIQLVFLYTGSLTDPDGDAPSYLAYMRCNVNAIVAALK
ncbi:MAG TPA: metal ABC transporter substrate-binding protein [Anaerolineae bacterium]|nr:metal ABC transporter substrate-binding protein [Anaerolineae bacterium]